MDDEWKKLQRELKILRAKQSSGGRLHPKDQARLQWLEERLGDAEAVLRHEIAEPVDSGPKVTTSDDHYATELSEQLLRQAEQQKLTKAWEQEKLEREKQAIAVRDAREGKSTFRQQGLSSFAVEVTEDLKEGEVGLAEVPEEEQEAAQKLDYHKAVYAQDESERLTKKSEKSANPFALDVADSLALGLDKAADAESLIPDTGAKSFGVDVDDDELAEAPTGSYEQVDPDAEKLLRQLGMSPGDLAGDDSVGAKTTHRAEDQVDAQLDQELVRQAVDYAEKKGLVEEEHVWATDDEGREIEVKPEDDGDQAVVVPQAPLPQATPRWSDEKPTRPGVDEATDETAVDLLAAAVQAEAQLGQPTQRPPEPPVPTQPSPAESAPAVLVPDPPDLSNGEEDEGPLLPEPPPEPEPEPEPQAPAGPPAVIALGGGEEDEETEIIDVDDSMIEAFDAGAVPDLSDDGDEPLELAVEAPAETTGESVAADDFWGLSAPGLEGTAAEDLQVTAKQPAPAPAAAEPAGPLPALSAVPSPAQPRKPRQVAPRVTKAPAATGSSDVPQSLMSLFEAPADSGGDGLLPADGDLGGLFSEPARKPSRRRTAENDLTGPRRATVHFKDGVNRRGIIGHVDTDADLIRLEPQSGSGGEPEDIVALSVKAIFLMVPRGTAYPDKQGQAVRLVMMDGRKLQGFTPDYDPNRKAFTLFPASDSGNIERVIVYNDAVKNIWFE